MRKKIKILFTIATFLICLSVSKSQASAERLSKTKDKEVINLINSAKEQRSVRESIRYLLYEEQYSVKKDGRVIRTIHALIKIFDERGKSFADMAFPYNSYYETCSVKLARTIQEDGSVAVVSKEATQDSSFFDDFPFYSDFKILQFSLSGVKPGSIIEYIIVTEDKKPTMKGFFSLYYPFGWDRFYSLVKLKIELPSEMEGKFIVKGLLPDSEKNPSLKTAGDKKIYSWEFKNFIQIFGTEILRPPDREVGVFALFTSIESWDKVADWLREMVKGQDAPDEKIISEVKNLTGPQSTSALVNNDLIKKLFYFVSQKVRYIAIELGINTWKPYAAKDVLSDLYGDCKGKATLLISMLKAAGIKSYYAFIRTKDSGGIISDMPSPFEFNHCIVAIPKEDGFMFLDPTPELISYGRLPPADQGVEAFILTEEGYKIVKTPESLPEDNFTDSSININIEENGSANVIMETNATGIESLAQRESVKYSDKYSREENYSKLLSAMFQGGGKLLKYETSDVDDIEKPLKTTIQFQINNYLHKVADKFTFILPAGNLLAFKDIVSGEYRKYDFWFSFAFSNSSEYTIKIPAEYKVAYLPEDITLNLPFASYSRSFKSENSKIYVKTFTTFKTREISVGKFGQFKSMIEKIAKHSSKEIILTN